VASDERDDRESDGVLHRDAGIYGRADDLVTVITGCMAKGNRGRRRRQWQEAAELLANDLELRIVVVLQGLPIDVLTDLAHALKLNRGFLMRQLDISRSIVASRLKTGSRLPKDESGAVLTLFRWVGEIEALKLTGALPEDFDSAAWVGSWLLTPHAALEGRTPMAFVDTAEGRFAMGDLIDRAVRGLYR
jgi:putative toxin-antitoxin system antitoxin component (TIGR02293 family)